MNTSAKTCSKCGLPGEFTKSSSTLDGLQHWCKQCRRKYAAARYQKNKDKILKQCAEYRGRSHDKRRETRTTYRKKNPIKYMLIKSRQRAKKAGIPFDLDEKDITIPAFCPLLGVRLAPAEGSFSHSRNAPSLDRIDPRLGYVRGNVWVISYKANAMKQDATPAELRLFAQNVLDRLFRS